MRFEDIERLADLRLQFHLGIELDHHEMREMLRLQGQQYRELGVVEPVRSDPVPVPTSE
jgi:hypothetical protein